MSFLNFNVVYILIFFVVVNYTFTMSGMDQ